MVHSPADDERESQVGSSCRDVANVAEDRETDALQAPQRDAGEQFTRERNLVPRRPEVEPGSECPRTVETFENMRQERYVGHRVV